MFTIPVPINSENIEDEEKRRQIKERFDYPGDYSIERLYMDLSGTYYTQMHILKEASVLRIPN